MAQLQRAHALQRLEPVQGVDDSRILERLERRYLVGIGWKLLWGAAQQEPAAHAAQRRQRREVNAFEHRYQ